MYRFQLAAAPIIVAVTAFFGGLVATVEAETGIASFYADRFQGRRTASGLRFDHGSAMCAHRTLRMGTVVKITRLSNGRSARCTIRDRGPYKHGRIIDVPKVVASQLGMLLSGLAKVRVERIR